MIKIINESRLKSSTDYCRIHEYEPVIIVKNLFECARIKMAFEKVNSLLNSRFCLRNSLKVEAKSFHFQTFI